MTINHEDDFDNSYDNGDDAESVDIDETESVPTTEVGTNAAEDTASNLTDADLAEAESLTVTAKQSIRQQLEDEVARFLAQGGQITEVPPDENAHT